MIVTMTLNLRTILLSILSLRFLQISLIALSLLKTKTRQIRKISRTLSLRVADAVDQKARMRNTLSGSRSAARKVARTKSANAQLRVMSLILLHLNYSMLILTKLHFRISKISDAFAKSSVSLVLLSSQCSPQALP